MAKHLGQFSCTAKAGQMGCMLRVFPSWLKLVPQAACCNLLVFGKIAAALAILSLDKFWAVTTDLFCIAVHLGR